MFGTKWAVYHTSTGNQLVALPVNTPKLPKGMKGNVDVVAGMRLIVNHASSSRHASPPRAGGPRGRGPVRRGHANAYGHRRAIVPRHDLPLRARVIRGAVPEPDPRTPTGSRRCRRPACADRARGSRSSARRRRRLGRQPVPQLLRHPGNVAEDPRRLRDPADHRELARRHGRLDGRPAARPVRPLGASDQREVGRRQRAGLPEAAGGAAPGHHQRRAATARRLGLVRGVRVDRVAVLGVTHTRRAHAGGGGRARDHGRRRRRRHRLIRVRPRRPAEQADLVRQEAAGVLAGELALRAGCGRHEPDAELRQQHRLHRPVERHGLPGAVHGDRGWRRRAEHLRVAAVVAARAVVRELQQADGARRGGLRRREPRLRDRLLERRQGCPSRRRRASRSSAGRARRRRSWRA